MMEKTKKFVLSHKKIFIILLFILLMGGISIYNSFGFYEDKQTHIIIKGKVGKIPDIQTTIMVQDKDANGNALSTYTLADVAPLKRYEVNESKSYCINGGTVKSLGKKAEVEVSGFDKCTIYYDVVPPDITITPSYNGGVVPPTSVDSNVTVTCDGGASATFNTKYNQLEISQVGAKKTNCTLTYTDKGGTSITYLNSKIKVLTGTTQGTGQVVNENGYRYEGKNPNNYVWFNNELWRIIGVFDSNSHGVSGQELVKIIREKPIGELAWDKYNTNDWKVSSLKALLNGAYLNREDGTNSGKCYGYSISVKANCDYTDIGIDASYRSMIEDVTWYLGGYRSSDVTADLMYEYERGTKVYTGRPTSDTGQIGLMYISDYVYASLASSCARTTKLNSYNSAKCAGENWLYGNGYTWTITPNSSNSYYVFNVTRDGGAYGNSVNHGFAVPPVLYLKSNVYTYAGDGSKASPYIIGMK